jgi:RND family efflux transporter MFP subunit
LKLNLKFGLKSRKEQAMTPVTTTTATTTENETHVIHAEQVPAPQNKKSKRGSIIAVTVAIAVLAAGAFGAVRLWPAATVHASAVTGASAPQIESVTTVRARLADANSVIALPAGTQAIRETTLYARNSGYVTTVLADIGDRVKAGQVLAEIDSPEVTQAVLQAQARLNQATANLELSTAMLRRMQAVGPEAVSKQEFDQQQAQVNVDTAAQKVAQADVDRLAIQQGYSKVVAPFDGYITARSIDPGALITAGSGPQVTSLFKIVDNDTLKVFVDVPQSMIPSVTAGQHVSVAFKEYPDRTFEGSVVRLNSALNAASRTRTVEVQIANADHKLLPGEYVQVQFKSKIANPPLIVPAGAVVIGKDGTHAVVVGGDGRLAFKQVELGRDYGNRIEVIAGISADDELVLNPTDRLRVGEQVQVKNAPQSLAAER